MIYPWKKKKTTEFKRWHGFLLIAIVFVALILGIVQRVSAPEPDDGIVASTVIVLNEETCHLAGGVWNECGSSCRQEPDALCVQVCVEQCECTADDQCPYSFSCGQYVDNIGICLSSSSD